MLLELPESHGEELSHEKLVQMGKVKVSKETTYPTNIAKNKCQETHQVFFFFNFRFCIFKGRINSFLVINMQREKFLNHLALNFGS